MSKPNRRQFIRIGVIGLPSVMYFGCDKKRGNTSTKSATETDEDQTTLNEPSPEPFLLQAESLAPTDHGSMEWNSEHNADLLTVSNAGMTVEWGPRKPEYTGKNYPPAWVPATTKCQLHSGRFSWDFVVNEMSERQIGVGFMLLWDVGPDWGFFGYLGASNTAWSYDPSTGDVVTSTESIQGNLPTFDDGHTGTVSVELNLPRDALGSGVFAVGGITSRPIELPKGAVVLPAACLLKESQKITIENFRTLETTA